MMFTDNRQMRARESERGGGETDHKTRNYSALPGDREGALEQTQGEIKSKTQSQ
jgi:hypothetical protein